MVAAALVLAGCGPDPSAPATPTSAPTAWQPQGATPISVLTNPGDGGEQTIRVGDRLRIPRSDDAGGFNLKDWRGRLVPYGDDRTYLAIDTGRVPVQETVYDEERPCVPPQPVAEFELVVAEGGDPGIPPARRLAARDANRTLTVVPGQELRHPERWDVHVTSHRDSVVRRYSREGTYAVRPGRVSVTLSPPDTGSADVQITIRVVEPERSTSSSSSDPAQSSSTAAPSWTTAPAGVLAAAPAIRPACA